MLAVILAFPFEVAGISARSAVLMDCTTGTILYSKDPDRQSLIASTTKIMTALIVCECCNVLDRVSISNAAVGIEGSSIYLQSGEVLTVQELLFGMMLHSGNDAAVALAIHCAGSVEEFVRMMNDKAMCLGLNNTHFANPHGLDEKDHYSTARDLGKLAVAALNNPIFSKIVATKNVRAAGRELRNHNKLLWSFHGADGVKTGYTKSAGRILVSSATRNGRQLVAVTIAAPDDWEDHTALLEMGFEKFTSRMIVARDTVLGKIEVAGGREKEVLLIAADDFLYAVNSDEQIKICLPDPGFVYAPVAAGQSAGYARIYLNDHWIGNAPIKFGKTIEMSEATKGKGRIRLFGGKTP